MSENDATPRITLGPSFEPGEVTGDELERIFDGIPINPEKVRHAIDLYCGSGYWVATALDFFQNAQVYAVDWRSDALEDSLENDPRVHFQPGMVVEVLKKKILPQAEFVSISFPYNRHGFNGHNMKLLRDIVGGYLLTVGDPIDNPLPLIKSFHKFFELERQQPRFCYLWRPK